MSSGTSFSLHDEPVETVECNLGQELVPAKKLLTEKGDSWLPLKKKGFCYQSRLEACNILLILLSIQLLSLVLRLWPFPPCFQGADGWMGSLILPVVTLSGAINPGREGFTTCLQVAGWHQADVTSIFYFLLWSFFVTWTFWVKCKLPCKMPLKIFWQKPFAKCSVLLPVNNIFACSENHIEDLRIGAANIKIHCSLVVWKLLFIVCFSKLHLKLSVLDHAIKKVRPELRKITIVTTFPTVKLQLNLY